jgi:pimeloyl-ACP methyl ester carboxylesterase
MFVMILMYLGLGIGTLIAAYVIYMLIVAIVPGFSVPKQPLDRSRRPSSQKDSPRSGLRKDVRFEVNGTALSAWLYVPEDFPAPVPCIIMGHGLGGTRAAGLDAYAVRFQDAGFAVLALDFRYLGDSGGEPRQLVWIPYQLEDYAAAIEYARRCLCWQAAPAGWRS